MFDIVIRNGSVLDGSGAVDSALSDSSENPVQNKTVKAALDGKETRSNLVTTVSASSTDTQYPSALAVWTLFRSITNGNEVSY